MPCFLNCRYVFNFLYIWSRSRFVFFSQSRSQLNYNRLRNTEDGSSFTLKIYGDWCLLCTFVSCAIQEKLHVQHNQPITEKNLFKLNRRINNQFNFLPFPHYPWPAFWLQQDLGPINLCPSPTHPSDNTYRHGLDIATAILMYL